jgi:hypothetical protein
MFVLTIDQRGSSADIDRVPELIGALGTLASARFERSVGDELQGVLDDANQVVDAALYALRTGHWYVGIGIGPASVAPGAAPREGTGGGFVAARKAVELAKNAAGQVPLSVVPGMMGRSKEAIPPSQEVAMASANAQAVLRLIGRVVQERTAAQWRVVDRLRAGDAWHGSQKQISRELGISEQSVSRAVHRSRWQEECAARPAAAMLLEHAHALLEPAGAGALPEGAP